MDPITMSALAGLGGPLLGGIFGGLLNNSDEKKAEEYQKKAFNVIEALKLPTLEEQQIALQGLVDAGDLTPEMLETISLDRSAMENVATDPRLRSAQMNALERLTQQGQEGLTAMDRLALTEISKENERATQARNASTLMNMAQRGMAGSGAELAAQLASNQSAAENAQSRGLNVAAQAQQRALEATMQGANLAGTMQGREFDQQSAVARAKDAINEFNARNRQNVAQYNVGNRNEAAKYNLADKQRISDSNVGLANQQQMYNKSLIGTQYERQKDLAETKGKLYDTTSKRYSDDANATVDRWVGVGKAGSEAASNALTKKKNPVTMAEGGQVPGKAEMEGDHPANDKVPAMLSPGEVVIPRSVLDEADQVILNFIKKARKEG